LKPGFGTAALSQFLEVLLTADRDLVVSFIERGADPIADHPFARAFHQLHAKTTIGSYLDCRRIRPDFADGLKRQADMALRQFEQEGNLKWVSLLVWAGADPRSRGPTVEDMDDSEWPTFAADCAASVAAAAATNGAPTEIVNGSPSLTSPCDGTHYGYLVAQPNEEGLIRTATGVKVRA
jgi:hypothetical protein